MSKYKIRYRPLFYEDLEGIIKYIQNELLNPQAANDLYTIKVMKLYKYV